MVIIEYSIDKRLFIEHLCCLSDIHVCILWFPCHNDYTVVILSNTFVVPLSYGVRELPLAKIVNRRVVDILFAACSPYDSFLNLCRGHKRQQDCCLNVLLIVGTKKIQYTRTTHPCTARMSYPSGHGGTL